MSSSRLLACLWPGLPRLWLRGDWRALPIAIAASAALNLALAAWLIWPEMLSPAWQTWLWRFLLVFWGFSAWRSYRMLPELTGVKDSQEQDALLVQAQQEYLKGHWLETESLLHRLLKKSARDLHAHLMLAALYRHTQQWEEARQVLRRLQQLQGSEMWSLEIQRELQAIESLSQEEPEQETETSEIPQESEEVSPEPAPQERPEPAASQLSHEEDGESDLKTESEFMEPEFPEDELEFSQEARELADKSSESAVMRTMPPLHGL